MSGRHLAVLVLIAACSAPTDDDRGSSPPSASSPPVTGGLQWREVPALTADSTAPVRVLWDTAANRPRIVVGAFAAPGVDAEASARSVLARHADLFALAPDGRDLALATTRLGRAGVYVRFTQQAGGLPVFDGEVIVLVAGGAVRAVNLAHHGRLAAPATAADLGATAALAAMRAAIVSGPERGAPVVERGLAVDGGVARLAYRVTVLASDPIATWRATIDAATGAVDGLRDLRVSATGTGLIFDSNAVDTTGNVNLTDNNDATSAALNNARFTLPFAHLDGSGFLRGTWVDARPSNAAMRANSPVLDYSYTRTDDHFEEAMVYYAIDHVQQRIEDLGFTNADNRVQVALVNAIPDDNSFYDPGTKQITYGDGGVDDAEDGDIIIHEYGHSIQDDQVPGWGGGDEGSMGEAFGDYIGGGFESTLAAAAGHPGMIDPACVGEWDATSYSTDNPPCLRRLDGPKHAPEDEDGEVHDDGEIWSAALYRARLDLGADIADTLVIEHHFLLSTSESFETASAALLAADTNLFAGANEVPLRRALFGRGVLRAPLAGPALPDVQSSLAVSVDNPRVGGNYAANLDDSKTVTLAGATAVRVHFTQIDTQTGNGPSCADGGCDNLYISDPAGDLYQILHGAQLDAVSVIVPGNTIVLRLVTNQSVNRFGYHVDRIDAMADDGVDAAPPADAALPPDARVDARPPPDAAAPPDGPFDAGLPPDAQVGVPDAGRPDDVPDAARTPDAAGTGDDGGGGCCQGSSGGSVPLAALVLALLIRRRRSNLGSA